VRSSPPSIIAVKQFAEKLEHDAKPLKGSDFEKLCGIAEGDTLIRNPRFPANRQAGVKKETYRSGEPLRHPKSNARARFSAIYRAGAEAEIVALTI
jgi:hypothetical protein